MGPVFRGEDGETSQPVAVTVLRVGLSPERAVVASTALATLRQRLPSHVALPAVLATGLVDDEPYVVTTLADGDPLDSALRQFGPAQLIDAVPRLRSVADALDTAAAVGLCHGRLHPRDIVVSVESTTVTGLGLAPLCERLGVTIHAVRPYAAPEVARGDGASPAADQYALGAIAYEWLTGRPAPLPAEMRVAVAGVSADDQAALSAALARAMAVDPGERYASATAFIEALSALLPLAAPRVRASRKSTRPPVPRLAFDDEGRDVAEAPADLDLRPRDAIGAQDDAPAPAEVEMVLAPSSVAPSFGVDDIGLSSSAPSAVDEAHVTPVDQPRYADEPRFDEATPAAPVPWRRWVLGIAAAAAVMLAGGWVLLRVGTPSAPVAEPAVTAPAMAPVTEPTASPGPAAITAAPAPTLPDRPAPLSSPPRPAGPASTVEKRVAAPPVTPRPPPRAAAPAAGRAAGRLLVRSTPTGAEVFVNGSRRGVTPLAVRDLGLGTYAVRVVRSGFAPVEQRVVLDAGRPSRSVEVALSRGTGTSATPAGLVASTGLLVVESRPAGARVTIDNASAGLTPLTLSSIAVGAHVVRIERAGYAPIQTTARVEAGAKARVAVTLTPERFER